MSFFGHDDDDAPAQSSSFLDEQIAEAQTLSIILFSYAGLHVSFHLPIATAAYGPAQRFCMKRSASIAVHCMLRGSWRLLH